MKNPWPLPGIKISPVEGLIKRNSYQILNINILIKSVITFKCTIEIESHPFHFISFVLKGSVEYPKLIFKPAAIQLERIAAGSFTNQPFTITNASNSDIFIEFNWKMRPTFFICNKEEKDSNRPLTKFSLKCEEKLELKLSYFPKDVSMSRFYLPICINDIFTPPDINTENCLDSKHYLEEHEK